MAARSITLRHNEAYHVFKRERGLDWLIKEKNKLEHKYGVAVERDLERRADSPITCVFRVLVDGFGMTSGRADRFLGSGDQAGQPGQGRFVLGRDLDRLSWSEVRCGFGYGFGRSGKPIFSPFREVDSRELIIPNSSSLQWLLSTECTLDTCNGLDKFNPTTSSTYRNGTTEFSIAYGSGDAQGHLGADTVTLGGFSVQGQTFGVVDTMSAGLVDSPLSGLMGLGFRSLTVTGTTPWWVSLAGSSAWSEPLFGFYMRRYRDVPNAAETEAEGGTLTLGYTDQALYEGDITYIPVDADKQRYWNIPIGGAFRVVSRLFDNPR